MVVKVCISISFYIKVVISCNIWPYFSAIISKVEDAVALAMAQHRHASSKSGLSGEVIHHLQFIALKTSFA